MSGQFAAAAVRGAQECADAIFRLLLQHNIQVHLPVMPVIPSSSTLSLLERREPASAVMLRDLGPLARVIARPARLRAARRSELQCM